MENNIQKVIEFIKKFWKMILICILISTLISSIITFFLIKPKYEAETKVFIGKQKYKSSGQNYNNDEVQLYQRLLKTYTEVIKTKNIAKAAIKQGDLDTTVAELLNNLSVSPVTDTQILQLKYKDDSPQECYDGLYNITKVFIDVFKVLYPQGNVQVIEQVSTIGIAINPNNIINIALGVIIGMIFGTIIAFLMEYSNHTFNNKEDLENQLGVSVLGIIPVNEEK